MAGLTSTGITIKTVDEILTDMESEQLANIDADLNVEADSVLGQLNGVYAAALAEIWELLEEIYQSAYPDTASGQSLSYIAALTGAIRQVATKAELDVHLEGVVDTVVPTGTRCYVDGDPDSEFETTAPATIAEEGTPDYVAVTMRAVTEGSATTAADTDDLVILTPVSGLDAITIDTVTDPPAFLEGGDEETDAELRFRREQSLAQAGSTTVDAIRADLLLVDGVDSCTVFENPTGETDSNGVPPYAIEVLVYNAEAPDFVNQEVADQIWASKPAGTQAYGTSGPFTVTDTSGNTHSIYFSEPTTLRTYVEVALTETSDGIYVGDDAVASAIYTWALTGLAVGQDVYASDIISVVADMEGVLSVDVLNTEVDDVTPTVSTNLTVAARQLATIAEEDVTVTST